MLKQRKPKMPKEKPILFQLTIYTDFDFDMSAVFPDPKDLSSITISDTQFINSNEKLDYPIAMDICRTILLLTSVSKEDHQKSRIKKWIKENLG
jgi:hypothetical protein